MAECLDSVLGQTLPADAYEVIAVDDGSTDESLSILQAYATKYPQVSVISIPNSGSAAAPRNAGLDRARGRYVFFLDADDVLAPTALEAMASLGDESGSDIILCRMASLGDRERSVPTAVFAADRFAEDFVASAAYRTLGAWKMFRRSLLEKHSLRFPIGYRIGEDQPFTMKAYLLGNHISALSDQPYYFIRSRADGTNTSRLGQSPQDNMTKALNVIKVVEENTEPGPRRDLLLARSLTDRAGLTASFRPGFAKLARGDQEDLVARAAPVAHLWTDRLRQDATAEVRVVLDLVFAGNVDELVTVARLLGTKRPLPRQLGQDRRTFVYAATDGTAAIPVPTSASAALEACQATVTTLRISAWIAAEGVQERPDAIRLVWRLRGREREVEFAPHGMEAVVEEPGTRFLGHFDVPIHEVGKRGTWDAYVEGQWGHVVLRTRLGWRSDRLDLVPTAVGVPVPSVVFFTPQHRNLAVDIGTRREHPPLRPANRLSQIVPDHRTMAVVVEGALDDDVHLEVTARRLGRTRTVRSALVRIDELTHRAAVPLRLQPGDYRFSLCAERGPTLLMPDDEAAPPAWAIVPGPDGWSSLARTGLLSRLAGRQTMGGRPASDIRAMVRQPRGRRSPQGVTRPS